MEYDWEWILGVLDQGGQVIESDEGKFINAEALSHDAGFKPWQGPQDLGLICLWVDTWSLRKAMACTKWSFSVKLPRQMIEE